MAGFNRNDWENLNITKEEVENISQALKKEEFRKLLSEYAEEITDPKNRKQYQDEIIQLEAQRGVDCTFVNPEPGFVVKTSVDGKKKAYINICKNKAVGRPECKPQYKDNNRGMGWSIPMCQSPGREDFDKKRKRCVIYDVVFHPDTLYLAERNQEFKQVVIDTALNAVEDSFKVSLDKKNIKFPKVNFKGVPFATVIRKMSKKPPTITKEDAEFYEKIKCPLNPPKESDPVVRNFDSVKKEPGKYTIPKYVIKQRSDIDLQDYTYDRNAKINAAIPKDLVIEVNLPLLNSSKNVTLDVMEKSLHLICDKPSKYKLDIQLPYSVNEETGNAKFDKDRKMLIITLPVVKARMAIKDLIREDSGVESDFSPVGSVSNNDFDNIENKNLEIISDSFPDVKEVEDIVVDKCEVECEESEQEKLYRTKNEIQKFLDSDKNYILPSFSCNVDGDKICFVLNVKNIDSESVLEKSLNSYSHHIKFCSIGSGFFPVYYAFLIDFKNEYNIKNFEFTTWDNNMTILIEVEQNNDVLTKYYVGIDEDSLCEHSLDHPLQLKKLMHEIISNDSEDYENDNCHSKVNVKTANINEVVISVIPEESEYSDDQFETEDEEIKAIKTQVTIEKVPPVEEKIRTFSESHVDEIMVSEPPFRKSILKKRVNRSLSESNANDYLVSSTIEKSISDESDFCNNERPHIKKTVHFSGKISQQVFRANSSILGRKNKNKKKSLKKKQAMERKLSQSENSETEEDKKTQTSRKGKKKKLLMEIIPKTKKDDKENSGASDTVSESDKEKDTDCQKPQRRLKKDDKIFEFKSDLIFDLDV